MIPPTLLKEAEAAAKHILFKAQILKKGDDMMTHLYKQGWFDCFACLSEMSKGEFDDESVRQESYRRDEEQTKKHGEEFLDTFSFIEGARHQHALDQAALLKAREERDAFKYAADQCSIAASAERAKCERLEKALDYAMPYVCHKDSARHHIAKAISPTPEQMYKWKLPALSGDE